MPDGLLRPVYFLVEGEDGRHVGVMAADELAAFKIRIRHLVMHGVETGPVPVAHHGEPVVLPAPETFRVTPLDAERQPIGKPETWKAEP